MAKFSSIEICAGAGGQAIGLESAGFHHLALVEVESVARMTLRLNRPNWNIIEGEASDVTKFNAKPYKGIDLLAGGVPCPPFSVAGKQLGKDDERDLFPQAIRLADECRPRAIMLENVRGLLDNVFSSYREHIQRDLEKLGYWSEWRLLNASDYGVPQLRPRAILVAVRKDVRAEFVWPKPARRRTLTVGQSLYPLMSARGWKGAEAWMEQANGIAPTIVGGSKKHGGPDLGPTRAKRAWAALGVNGHLIADAPPEADFEGLPCLTVAMVARLQGFKVDEWTFAGRKTAAYRQIGNAFPPPVAYAVGRRIRECLRAARSSKIVSLPSASVAQQIAVPFAAASV